MQELLETGMLIAFGFAWPINLYNSIKAKSAKGKSLFFLLVILLGYVFGISAKIIGNQITYVLIFYLLNFAMVSTDVLLYFRNKNYDLQRERESQMPH